MMTDKHLTTRDLAARWNISESALRNYRMQGRGPKYFKAGSGKKSPVRYRMADIIDYETRDSTQQGAGEL